jgi:hypothetical protein
MNLGRKEKLSVEWHRAHAFVLSSVLRLVTSVSRHQLAAWRLTEA